MRFFTALLTVMVLLQPWDMVTAQLVPDTEFLKTSPAAEGTIRQYLIDPRGEVEGIVLKDGSQIVFTSRVQRDIIASMKPGSAVRIEGRRHQHFPLVEPDIITSTESGATVHVPSLIESPIPEGKEALTVRPMHADGLIDILLYDRYGRVSGCILQNDTQVRFPPDMTMQLRRSFHMGDNITVEGNGTENQYGRAIEATAIGRYGAPLTPIDKGTNTLKNPRAH